MGGPKYFDALTCRHCGNKGPMRIAGTVSDTDSEFIDDSGACGPEHGMVYEILVCAKCEGSTLRAGFYYDGMDLEEWSPSILYPAERKSMTGLPPAVQKEYEAAKAVASISPNAYAVLLGRVLDAVSVDRGAAGDSLYKRLEDLANKGEIPKNLAEMAQNVRQFRNVGAHADLGSLTVEEIPFLESLSSAVLEYIYEAPRMVEEAQARLASIKLK